MNFIIENSFTQFHSNNSAQTNNVLQKLTEEPALTIQLFYRGFLHILVKFLITKLKYINYDNYFSNLFYLIFPVVDYNIVEGFPR